jgi:selenocysteine lyase/cysteine desulfurase
VIWAGAPDRFEAGTPAIVNIIAFAKALRMMQHTGKELFMNPAAEKMSAREILYHDELEKYSGRELLDHMRQTLIGRGMLVPTTHGPGPFVNLDNSASTPTFTPVWNAVRQTWRQPAEVQREIIHEVKSIIAGFVGAPLSGYDVVFTSNTTEAINLAAETLGRVTDEYLEPVTLNTLLEHSSNDLPWRQVPCHSLIRLQVDGEGFIDLMELDSILCAYNKEGRYGRKRIMLVAISGASNVLGTSNDLNEISRIVHSYGALLLVDAAQLVAHRKVNMEACGIDFLAFSAHKVYAPFGCGVLLAKKWFIDFSTAGMELIRSSGEENTGGIAALGKALLLLQRIGMDLIREEEQALTAHALRSMAAIPGLTVYGINDPDSARFAQKIGVIVFAMKGMMADKVAMKLALEGGIGVRFGCHCAHVLIKNMLHIGPGLERFQGLIVTLFPRMNLPGLARVSFGLENTEQDVHALIQSLEKMAGKPQDLTDKKPAAGPAATTMLKKSEVQKQLKELLHTSSIKVYGSAL